MKGYWIALTSACLFPLSTHAADSDVCGRIIDHGLNNIALATNAESYTDRLYWRFCDEKYENLTDQKKVEFGATIKSIPLSLGGESASASEKHAKFCGDYRTFTDRQSDTAIYTAKLHDRAIDAWSNCLVLTRSNLFIDFQVPQSQRYVDVAMKYTGPSPATFTGVETDGLSCTRNGTPVDAATSFGLGTSEEHLRCVRSPTPQNVGGVSSDYFPSGGVTVKTNAGRSSLEFVPMVDGPARGRFEQIDTNLLGVRKLVTDLSTNLQAWGGKEDAYGNKVGWGDHKGSTVCPAGHYLVGLQYWVAPGNIKYCIGCVSGVRAVCRPINQVTGPVASQAGSP